MTETGKEVLKEKIDSSPKSVTNWKAIADKVKAEIRTGIVSSVIAEAALFPLDVVKLQQQVSGGSAGEVFRRVLSERGVWGMYNGLIGRLIQTVTSNVGFFIWQTIAIQVVTRQVTHGQKLQTGMSLVVNMLAQQFNRLLTTPVDVVANVNQTDPNSKGFFATFLHLARTGGRQTLWRGLPVSLVLSLNPALMYTLVGKISTFMKRVRNCSGSLAASDMFWISGVSKAIATLVTYPLIRAKSVQQTVGTGLGMWSTFLQIFEKEGTSGLYAGVWMLSYKTVLFNSLMMALKQKLSQLETQWLASSAKPRIEDVREDDRTGWKKNVKLASGQELPWAVAARGGDVVYADGSWCFLHSAQEYLLQAAREHGDYLVVGVHSDQTHQKAVGSWPAECFAARADRLLQNGVVDAVLESAPWHIDEQMMKDLRISKVVAGTVSKLEDCSSPVSPENPNQAPSASADPYEVPKRLNCFYTIQSLNEATEYQIWTERASRILFSNVDASIDWRILVKNGSNSAWGQNPGYRSPKADRPRTRSASLPWLMDEKK